MQFFFSLDSGEIPLVKVLFVQLHDDVAHLVLLQTTRLQFYIFFPSKWSAHLSMPSPYFQQCGQMFGCQSHGMQWKCTHIFFLSINQSLPLKAL